MSVSGKNRLAALVTAMPALYYEVRLLGAAEGLVDFEKRKLAGGLVQCAPQKRASHIGMGGHHGSGFVIKKEINHTFRQLILPDIYLTLLSEGCGRTKAAFELRGRLFQKNPRI